MIPFTPLLVLCIYLGSAGAQLSSCRYWGAASAISHDNSTLYLIGGRSVETTGANQEGSWTNALYSIPLSESWNIDETPSNALPNNLPALALGALYATESTLTYFGGASSDMPFVEPPSNAIYSYDIAEQRWSTVPLPEGYARAAEGASAISFNSRNESLAYYAFGHQDYLTDPNHSIHTPRVTLDSIISYNPETQQFNNYSSVSAASRIDNFRPRADSTLTFLPFETDDGVLISIGGLSSDELLSNARLDVFNLTTNTWSRTSTSGDNPLGRVNHCAVTGRTRINGVLQHQIIVFGGQNLEQTEQYNDVYVLTYPGLRWYSANTSGSRPSPRAAASCEIVGSQLLIMGGYTENLATCDEQIVSVLDVETMSWQTRYDSAATTYRTPRIVADELRSASPEGSSSTQETWEGASGSNREIRETPASETASSRQAEQENIATRTRESSRAPSATSSDEARILQDQEGVKKPSMTGIIVGAVVGALALLGALLFFLRRQKKRHKHTRLGSDAGSDIDSIFDASEGDNYSDPFITFSSSTEAVKSNSDSTSSFGKRSGVEMTRNPGARFALESRSLLSQYSAELDDVEEGFNPVIIVPPSTPGQSSSSTSQGREDPFSDSLYPYRPDLRQRRSANSLTPSENDDRSFVSQIGAEMAVQQTGDESARRFTARERLSVANPSE